MITQQSIIEAHNRIKPFIHQTPVMTSVSLDEVAGCMLYFKSENFQKVGAFKSRGAMNAVLSMTREQRARGVATHSSGNHAQALARAAKIMGTKAYIVMPRTAPQIKRLGVIGYGGQIFECEPNLKSREETLAKVVEEKGAYIIHPFNNYEVITGQATAAKEFFEEIHYLDFLVAPVGGGGLLSGSGLAAKFFSPHTTVIGAEPEGADDAFRSMESGMIEPSQADTVADGLLTTLGTRTFPIIQETVKKIITVSDVEIISAMRLIWDRLKIIVEPSAAVALAAVLKAKDQFRNKSVGIILSGGNVDLERAVKLFASV
ncbi:MAG TPA: pyridoxal-phosphate dependent enzyme [Chryseosolibacter sp.]|nr:pyridoxal-phosphate dependent enzyme [Chryseosolibacter sp.]